jgi:hypothetical protein
VTVHTDAFKGLTDRCFLCISEMIDLLQADIADQKPCVTATEVQISRLLRRPVSRLDEIEAHLKKMDGHPDNMEEQVAAMQESLK